MTDTRTPNPMYDAACDRSKPIPGGGCARNRNTCRYPECTYPYAPDTVVADQYAYLVISDRVIGWATIDRERAHEYARNTGSVVVQVPIVADYRQPAESR